MRHSTGGGGGIRRVAYVVECYVCEAWAGALGTGQLSGMLRALAAALQHGHDCRCAISQPEICPWHAQGHGPATAAERAPDTLPGDTQQLRCDRGLGGSHPAPAGPVPEPGGELGDTYDERNDLSVAQRLRLNPSLLGNSPCCCCRPVPNPDSECSAIAAGSLDGCLACSVSPFSDHVRKVGGV